MVANAENSSNPASFWRQISRMTTKKKKKKNPLTIQDENGRTHETEHQIAKAFARKLEKQFQIYEGEDVDFDQEFTLGINAELRNRKPPSHR